MYRAERALGWICLRGKRPSFWFPLPYAQWACGWTSTPWRWRSFSAPVQPSVPSHIHSGIVCENSERSRDTTFIAACAHLDPLAVKKTRKEGSEAGAFDWNSATNMFCNGMLSLARDGPWSMPSKSLNEFTQRHSPGDLLQFSRREKSFRTIAKH
jgi:hypothetical protein